MIHRRKLLIALGAGSFADGLAGGLTGGFAAHAQQPPQRMRRIGYFTQGSIESNAPFLAAFRAGMTALHWVEGRDYAIDARYTDGNPQNSPRLSAELVAKQPELLLTAGDESLRALLEQTKTIPIVGAIMQDPVGLGLVASLRRPGGNATGLTSLASGLGPKRLQLLKEALPRLTHVVVLFEAGNIGSVAAWKEIEAAARHLKLRATPIEIRQPADIEAAFERGAALRAQAYLATQGGLLFIQRQALVGRTVALKVPLMSTTAATTDAGGLMSYGASLPDNFRRAAGYVDKIFKGAKPGELPMQQPVTFEFVVNLKTAKTIGITLPPVVLLQADRVIE